MKSRTTLLLRWVSVQLGRAATFLDNLTNPTRAGSKFIDLAPTDEGDKEGAYAEALNYATSNERVFNIALTGPYGSGKSSIIKSFLKRYPRPALNISLAAFVPGQDTASKDLHRQEVERSILQQMLYGADANRLPLSRFKRIRSPGVWSIFKTLFILIGAAATAYVFLNRKNALFAGSDGGGELWAVIASLVETCKLDAVDPQAYLGDVIARIVAGHPQSQIDDLLPWAYAPQPLKAVA